MDGIQTKNMSAEHLLFGLEEEVFVTEPLLPSLASLNYLARLMWRNPSYYYTHSASNFARGKDLRQAVMSGIEVSTRIHSSIDSLIEDLSMRRKELASVCDGLILPIGHLFDLEAPTNTCGLHIHVGPVPEQDIEQAYSNLAHFLPLLALLTVNSPIAGGRYFGQSFRIAKSYAIGPLRKDDKKYRFQDMIVSKRLGTIELRIFDPVWDLGRVRALLRCIEAILKANRRFAWDEDSYKGYREAIMKKGYGASSIASPGNSPGMKDSAALYIPYSELRELCDVDETLFQHTASDELYNCWKKHGTLRTYIILDNAYRNGIFDPEMKLKPEIECRLSRLQSRGAGERILRAISGLVFYYAIKLPYIIMKGLKEQ